MSSANWRPSCLGLDGTIMTLQGFRTQLLIYQVTAPLIQGMVPLFGLYQIQSNGVTQTCISSQTHNWYLYQTWEIEKPNLWFTQMAYQAGVGSQNILLILAPMCFLWNNLWSVCCYRMGCGCCRLGWACMIQPLPFQNVGQESAGESVIPDPHFS